MRRERVAGCGYRAATIEAVGECDPFAVPPRPKGMRATTYERIHEELREVQFRRDELYAHDLHALVQRLERFTK